MSNELAPFAERLLSWFEVHGRHDLPWQHPRTPYRVWVSEVMLQQTRVTTVIPYFEKWMQRFPDIETLASATQDEVLEYWAGLGYYARGRNLHKAAQQVVEQHGGKLPQTLEALESLLGIGRSTAGAILAQAWDIPTAILDGNVKRVLSRHQAIVGWPGKTGVLNKLWQISETYTPDNRAADYTQAIMDLGSSVCRRSKPACELCPVQNDCQAFLTSTQADFPGKAPKKKRPLKSVSLLVALNNDGEVLLQRNPPAGIWGGLWSLPTIPDKETVLDFCPSEFGFHGDSYQLLATIRHGFTHFELDIEPLLVNVQESADKLTSLMDAKALRWFPIKSEQKPGLPAPISRLLDSLAITLTQRSERQQVFS